MELPRHYADLVDGDAIESWPLYAYLPSRAGYLSQDEALRRIRTCPNVAVASVEPPVVKDFAADAHWELEVSVGVVGEAEPWWLRVFIAPSEPLEREHLDWDGFSDSERDESLASRWEIGVAGVFGDRPAEDYQTLLRLLAALAPNMVAIYDSASFRVHAGAWAIETAGAEVPPPLEVLFSVHSVHPETEEEGSHWWVHTHGLIRAGCIELEALEVPEGQVDTIADFLGQVAAQFLDLGLPDPDTPFTVGEKLELVWLPWETGIERVPEGALGTSPDRDEIHAIPSGVLLVPARGVRKRRYLSLSSCVPTLERNPIYYVSDGETDRAGRLARAKLAAFMDLQGRFHDQRDWSFTVKLGFESEPDDEDVPTHEHLWFEVHRVRGRTVDATLLNQPYYVKGLAEGQRGEHSLDRLTDWTIYTPHGTFTPDRLYHLLRLVGDGG